VTPIDVFNHGPLAFDSIDY